MASTATGSRVAIHPRAGSVRVYAVKDVIPAVTTLPTIVITGLIKPRPLVVNKEVSICHEDEDTHHANLSARRDKRGSPGSLMLYIKKPP